MILRVKFPDDVNAQEGDRERTRKKYRKATRHSRVAIDHFVIRKSLVTKEDH